MVESLKFLKVVFAKSAQNNACDPAADFFNNIRRLRPFGHPAHIPQADVRSMISAGLVRSEGAVHSLREGALGRVLWHSDYGIAG